MVLMLLLLFIANDCFHRVTGLSHQQMKRITLFSLIQAEKLSKLYELVAQTIASSNSPSKNGDLGSSPIVKEQFKTIALPCISFPKELPLSPMTNAQPCLYMNVSYRKYQKSYKTSKLIPF